MLFVEAKGVKGGPLRDLSDRLRQQEKADGAIVASVEDGRAFLVVNFDESLVSEGSTRRSSCASSASTSAAAGAASRRWPRPAARIRPASATRSRPGKKAVGRRSREGDGARLRLARAPASPFPTRPG